MATQRCSEEYLEPAELMRELHISRATYYRWLKDGLLTGVKVGRRWRFPRSAVDRLLGKEDPALEAPREARRILAEWLGDIDVGGEEIEALDRKSATVEQAVARMIVEHALSRGATDVHVEPVADGLGVRERLHGALVSLEPALPPHSLAAAFEHLAGMDPEKKGAPQTGRFFVDFEGRKIDVRASTYPTGLGQSVTLRLMDPAKVILKLDESGLNPEIVAGIRTALGRRYGVFLVNGPTGSGKTTIHYMLLSELLAPGVKIMTVEDPVELYIDGILQANVGPEMGFRDAMRAMLVNDLDIGMVSELRDRETIELLFQMAGTGHLLLSALHARDAVTAVHRALTVGELPPRLLVENLLGVLDQRLVPKSCPHCRTRKRASREDARRLALEGSLGKMEMSYNRGCERCCGTGFQGRTLVAELLVPGPEMNEAIEAGIGSPEDLRATLPAGRRTLLDDLHEKLASGEISPPAATHALGA